MKYLEMVRRTRKLAARAVFYCVVPLFISGCGASGVPNKPETWNSYYYGSAPMETERGVPYYDGVDSDSNYQLPREYLGASDARIPSDNLIHTNPY